MRVPRKYIHGTPFWWLHHLTVLQDTAHNFNSVSGLCSELVRYLVVDCHFWPDATNVTLGMAVSLIFLPIPAGS